MKKTTILFMAAALFLGGCKALSGVPDAPAVCVVQCDTSVRRYADGVERCTAFTRQAGTMCEDWRVIYIADPVDAVVEAALQEETP